MAHVTITVHIRIAIARALVKFKDTLLDAYFGKKRYADDHHQTNEKADIVILKKGMDKERKQNQHQVFQQIQEKQFIEVMPDFHLIETLSQLIADSGQHANGQHQHGDFNH